MAVFLVANRRFQGYRFLRNLQNLAYLFERHGELFGKLFRCRLPADFMQHLARGTHQLVDRLDHMHRNTDGARLVGNRTRDRLTDPPCRISGELVTAAIFELIHRLHQADIAFLNEIKKLQPAIGVFLRDGNNETKVRLHHFLLRDARLALTLLHRRNDAAIFGNIETGFGSQRLDFLTQFLHLIALILAEIRPAFALEAAYATQPVRIEFITEILLEEFLARHAVAFSQTEQSAFQPHKALVDRVKLFNKALNTVVVERKALHFFNEVRSELLIFLFLRGGEFLRLQRQFDLLVLQLAELLVVGGNGVECLQHLRLEFGFHRGERHIVLVLAILIDLFFLRLDARRRLARKGGLAVVDLLGVGACIGCVEVDDVAKENFSFVQLVAPDDDGLKGQRAFTKPGNHRLAASLDALGNGDFAFARQKLNRAHLAKIHADRIVGAVERSGGGRRGGNGLAGRLLLFL